MMETKQPPMPDFGARMREENNKKASNYRYLNQFAQKGQIVFTGSSLMEQFPLNELMMSAGIQKVAYNRGFGGYITTQLLEVLDDCILDLEPSKLFINIGTNDLDLMDDPIGNLVRNYREILNRIRQRLPKCQILMIAYYPVCREITGGFTPPPGKRMRTKEAVDEGNTVIMALADEFGIPFINVNHVLADEDGYLRPELASDSIHMWPNAYQLILEELKPYI